MATYDSLDYVSKTQVASRFIETKLRAKKGKFIPEIALTLGSGLGGLEKLIEIFLRIQYVDIPNFPRSTVEGHKGELIAGYLEGVPIIGLSGRKHYYEVADQPDGMLQVVFPVHVVANLGCRIYFATNAAGGLNLKYNVGDLMLLKSHISFFLPNPLLGKQQDFGDNLYFQPMDKAYSIKLRKLFLQAAGKYSMHVYEGVYIALTGRTYETQAESLLLRSLGVDAVGMSTVSEVIVATNRGLETIAVSVITNKIAKDGTNTTTHTEVQAILNNEKVKKRTATILKTFFKLYNSS